MTGDALRELMRRRGLRRADIAWACGVSDRTVTRWLRWGTPLRTDLALRALLEEEAGDD